MRAPITLLIVVFSQFIPKSSILIKLSKSVILTTLLGLKMKKVVKWLSQYRDEYTNSFPIGFHSNLLPPRTMTIWISSKLPISNERMLLANFKYVIKNIWSHAFYRPNFTMLTTCQKPGSKCWANEMSFLQCTSFQIF
jgi:hypothetical protein